MGMVKKSCMVCGIELKECGCTGKILEMSINLCEEHTEFCENCEEMECE